jgi:hypothetical protein
LRGAHFAAAALPRCRAIGDVSPISGSIPHYQDRVHDAGRFMRRRRRVREAKRWREFPAQILRAGDEHRTIGTPGACWVLCPGWLCNAGFQREGKFRCVPRAPEIRRER